MRQVIDIPDIQFFNGGESPDSFEFLSAMTMFNRYFYAAERKEVNPILREWNSIKENFNGFSYDYLLTELISHYSRNVTPSILDDLKRVSEFAKQHTTDAAIKEDLKIFTSNIDKLNKTLPEELLSYPLDTKVGDSTSLNEIISNNKTIIIDFWASWCRPCLKDIDQSHEFRNELSRKLDVKWVYISIDTDKKAWLKAVKILNVYNLEGDQLLFVRTEDLNQEKFVNYLNMVAIPQYAIISREGKLIIIDAPKPSKNDAFSRIVQEISNL